MAVISTKLIKVNIDCDYFFLLYRRCSHRLHSSPGSGIHLPSIPREINETCHTIKSHFNASKKIKPRQKKNDKSYLWTNMY